LGSITGQAMATKGRLREIAAAGMVLTGLGCLSLSQVRVDGSYLGDIFFGLLLFGPGLGAAYVAASIASLADIPEADAGVASGLNNSSFQIGGAVGVAILSTVAVSQAHGADPLSALTNGFQSAFAIAIVFAMIGLVFAGALLGRPRLRAPAPAAGPA
ncbi:MAG TPA: MFS transporter, partial [Microbacterium sp.]|nr:MFS transporter [Microbacterium sp.]